MASELIHWVKRFEGLRVLLVGDLILDRYLYGDAERISPEAPVPVLKTVDRREAVGGSGNVAACLAALGCRVTCCGVVGDDRHGDTLSRLLGELGVNTSGVVRLADRPTTTKTRLVGLAQHRHRQQLLRVDEEDSSPLPQAAASSLESLACKAVAEVDVVCIEDYDKGMISPGLVKRLIEEASKHHRKVLVDPGRLSDYGRYQGATIITPNREELSMVSGRRLESLEEVASAARDLLAAHAFSAVVTTLDREGALVVERNQDWRHVPTVPRSVYDNTGAGDAVLATLSAAIAAGADLFAAAQLANIAGGLEVEKFGCVPIPVDEILAELRLKDRLRSGKLRGVEELTAELHLRRDRGETVAFTNGCFDLFHAGHVDFLQRCRQEASTLVVGLNSDASIKSLSKGDHRPINKLEHRVAVLSAMECVDYVVTFEESDPGALIQEIKPDVLIKGQDWEGKEIVGQTLVEANGGRVVLLPLVEGLSTTKLIERICKSGS